MHKTPEFKVTLDSPELVGPLKKVYEKVNKFGANLILSNSLSKIANKKSPKYLDVSDESSISTIQEKVNSKLITSILELHNPSIVFMNEDKGVSCLKERFDYFASVMEAQAFEEEQRN
ncbi:hypothetical protein GF354_00915 [Candidatus Peregrinibacteria bacterium]|nr:hypothetical protein [Candidatus Peregrinibacteria bacterium]